MSNKENAKLLMSALSKYLIAYIMLGLLFFFTAGTVSYVNGWIYLISMAFVMGVGMIYLFANDKDLLKKRMQFKEKESKQVIFIIASIILITAIYIIPGLDYRFKWSNVPLWLVIVAEVILIIGYFMDLRVMVENSYASRVIEIQDKQKVIDTGLYSLIRHPMYLSMTLMFLATPIILGSFIGLIPSVIFPFVLALRIINEEKVLRNGLDGYDAYTKKVKFRLIPYIW